MNVRGLWMYEGETEAECQKHFIETVENHINKKMRTAFIVGYRDKWHGIMHEVFVTTDEVKAIEWCVKFDRILREYKNFLKRFEDETGSFDMEDDCIFDKWYSRWIDIQDIDSSYKLEIKIR